LILYGAYARGERLVNKKVQHAHKTKITRKLRAIFSADVKGYSILMADNEVRSPLK
jgi:hypothetical protein